MASLNRRDFLKAGVAGSILLTSGLRGASQPTAVAGKAGKARNVIFMVSDGMSIGTLALAERYRRMIEGRGTNWLSLYTLGKEARRALVDTRSANSLVTDSAAGSSAWGCGHKVNNGALNYTPDGQKRPTIVRLAKEAGYSAGLVTTAKITHATPAGFTAQVKSRVDEDMVAEQYLDIGVDVLLGGGSNHFDPEKRKDKRDMYGAFSSADYRIVKTAEKLKSAGSGRILGTFTRSHIPFKIDRVRDPEAVSIPALPDMVRVALQRLEKNPRGFILQIEGARIDHAAHANDTGAIIHEQLEFDDAIGVVLKFIEGRDDTLLIVTSDHGNANPGLSGTGGSFNSRGGSYGDTQKCFERLRDFRQSNSWILKELSKKSSPEQIRERVKAANGVELEADEVELLQRALRKDPAPREGYRVRNKASITLAQLISNYTSIGWVGTAHTTDFVEMGAVGPGSEAIGGFMQNNEMFGVMARALDLKI